ncbi:MAG: hypothetical protein ACLFUP_04115, partial [Desulfobacteraceae bacterium]
IQHNLDWVWPYWVERQFNPGDPSFIPRAFSITHVNLTHRNWTAVGRPDLPLYPIVDPRGLVTPFFDGWSLDAWIIPEQGAPLLPSKLHDACQALELRPDLRVRTVCFQAPMRLETEVRISEQADKPEAVLKVTGSCGEVGGWIAVSLRPYNPEGVQFIERIRSMPGQNGWIVDDGKLVHMLDKPERVFFSSYKEGDVYSKLKSMEERTGGSRAGVKCDVGMATAAALFPVSPGEERTVRIRVPLGSAKEARPKSLVVHPPEGDPAEAWSKHLSRAPRLELPDSRMRFLYQAALRTILLLTAGDAFPGPYTYRRFWFRDAAFMLNALLNAGYVERARRILDSFPERQKRSGYFQSQEGEWDSNGQVLWILNRFEELTGAPLEVRWMEAVLKGAAWITRKRIRTGRDTPHEGLFPPGFSAEHLGPNDYYYWDAFWGVSGLKAAARLSERYHSKEKGAELAQEAEAFRQAVFRSIERSTGHMESGCIPAAPYRRMDAGAIGSLVADYPLRLIGPGDPFMIRTVEYLLEHCFYEGAFFQDMIHSGLNAYITLAVAQTLLRSGDARYRSLVSRTAELASETGQWPEAIHPATGGGCMGDGQHGWAAAEWLEMMRSLFLQEEEGRMVIGAGLFPQWLGRGKRLFFGPTLTPYGRISIRLRAREDAVLVNVEGDWQEQPPLLEARVPGCRPAAVDPHGRETILKRR